MKRNIWHSLEGYPEILLGQYVVPNFVSNSVCLKIDENEFLLYSPGSSLLESWPYKDNKELTIHIVLPNAYHHLGVGTWLEHFPNSKIYASDCAIKQLRSKKTLSAEQEIISLNKHLAPLPKGYKISFPLGHRAGDIWLIKRIENKNALWITCDSFLNYERVSNQPVAKLMQKVLGAAPGLKISQVIKWFILNDRKEFKTWTLKKIKSARPIVLIPSHGEVIQSESLAVDLEHLLNQRL